MQSSWLVISPFASDADPIFTDEDIIQTSFAIGLVESKIDFAKKRGPLLLLTGDDGRRPYYSSERN